MAVPLGAVAGLRSVLDTGFPLHGKIRCAVDVREVGPERKTVRENLTVTNPGNFYSGPDVLSIGGNHVVFVLDRSFEATSIFGEGVNARKVIVLSMLTFGDAMSCGAGRMLYCDRGLRFPTPMECPHCHGQLSSQAKHCKRCGGAIPSGQYLLNELGLDESGESKPVATPSPSSSGSAAPVRTANRFRFARLGDRFIAFLLDTFFLFGIFAVVDAWAFMRWSALDGAELQLTAASLIVAFILNSAILFVYGWLLEASCGATLGKVLVGIRIVRTSDRSALSASAIRNVVRIVDGLGFYIVAATVACCSSVRQRIGDICAHTAVVEEKFGIGIRIVAMVLWMASLGGAGWLVPRICATDSSVHPKYFARVAVRVGKAADSAYLTVGGVTVDVHSSALR